MSLLSGKYGVVFGVANKRSIAWAIAQAWQQAGAKLAFTCQGERVRENVEELAATFGADTPILPCDVTRDDEIARVFAAVGQQFGKLHRLLHSVAGFTQMLKHYAEHAPLQRNITPEELGAAGVFLASDGAAAITGQVLYVDGGYQIMGM
jgi:enoyl-[acyl-carrier-protein] reductase (NADH)